MRTTIDIDDALLARARALRPQGTKTELVEAGLRALVELDERRRLVALFGTEEGLCPPARRRP
jgi:Arc/MetJ family transcription regulator